MTKRIPGKTGAIKKGTFPVLDAEMTRALQFLKEIFAIDPAVHIYKYLNMLPVNKCVIWSDASGYEIETNNPTPGRLASLFVHKFAKKGQIICAYSDWNDILPLLRNKVPDLDQVPWFSCKSCTRLDLRQDDLAIAYLELSAFFFSLIELIFLCLNHPKIMRRVTRKVVIFKCDNTNVCAWGGKGRIKFFPWNRLFEFLCIVEIVLECKIKISWVPSDNQKADKLTRSKEVHKEFNRTFKVRKHRKQTITWICTYEHA